MRTNMSDQYQEVFIHYQPVELCKLLKIANLVSGGEAKIVITQGYVLLNGEVECQKRKKIISGDIIEFNGETIKVSYREKAIEPKKMADPQKNKNSKNKNSKHKGEISISPNTVGSKKNTRKPISF